MGRVSIQQAYDLAVAHHQAGRWPEAEAIYRQILSLQPNHAPSLHLLGIISQANGQLETASDLISRAIAHRPNAAAYHLNLGNVLKDLGDIRGAVQSYDRALACDNSQPSFASTRLYALNYHPDWTRAAIFQELRKYNARYAQPLARFIRPHANDRSPVRRLKIGYVSADFREHAAGLNFLALILNHDRANIETFGYFNNIFSDARTAQTKAACDHWHVVAGVDDETFDRQIRADGIDILVDLSLHSGGNRLPVFARKPAPLAVTFIGYPGSTGLDAIDYRISDPHLDPPGETERYCSEKTLHLPNCFWCYDPSEMGTADEDEKSLPALAAQRVTFGCLNASCKINDAVLECWARVLNRIPDSRLVLLLISDSNIASVTSKLARHGIAPGRVDFLNRRPRNQYLQNYRHIDIGLDTFPYNGHTTSLDALWMGVPVVTKIGDTVVGRAGLSQLSNLGLENLAAENVDVFANAAVNLAGDLPRLADLRRDLRKKMLASPLCDAKAFAANVEALYRRIWREWCRQ